MSQENLGDKLGITFQQVQKYEKGTNRITASRLDQVAKVLGCPLLWLYGKDADVGTLPTPDHILAERMGLLSPLQQAALKGLADAMLEAHRLIEPTPSVAGDSISRHHRKANNS